MSVNMIISFKVKPDSVPAFETLLAGVKANLPKVNGCGGVKVFKHADDPTSFTLVENWESKELHGSQVRHLIDSGEWNKLAAHLAADPVSNYYVEI